jgi:hypothetical protein
VLSPPTGPRRIFVTCASKMRRKLFRDMRTAPTDGTEIEVICGPNKEVVVARWSGQDQAWIRADDPDRRSLHRVSVLVRRVQGAGGVLVDTDLNSERPRENRLQYR